MPDVLHSESWLHTVSGTLWSWHVKALKSWQVSTTHHVEIIYPYYEGSNKSSWRLNRPSPKRARSFPTHLCWWFWMCILAATNKIQGITKFRDLLCVSMSLFASHKLGYTSQVVSYIHLCRRSFPTFDGCFPAKCPPPLPWRVRKPPTKSQRRWSRLVKRWRHLLQQKCPWCCGGTCALALTVACTRIWCYCYGLPFNGAHGILQIGS